MAYQSWSVVFGEQPSAAKWNIIGTNMSGFNDGTAIATGAITSSKISGIDKSLTTTDSNPYKFSAYLSADQTGLADATFTKLQCNTELFDTNSNYDNATNYRYTVPVTGYYSLNYRAVLVSSNATGVSGIVSLYINGVEYVRSDLGNPSTGSTANVFAGGSTELVTLTAGDYAEIYVYIDTTSGTRVAAAGVKNCRFSGYMVSRT